MSKRVQNTVLNGMGKKWTQTSDKTGGSLAHHARHLASDTLVLRAVQKRSKKRSEKQISDVKLKSISALMPPTSENPH